MKRILIQIEKILINIGSLIFLSWRKIIALLGFFWIAVLPFLLISWLFLINNDLEIKTINKDEKTHFSVDTFSKNHIKSSVQRTIGGSFNLDRYNFCIKNDFPIKKKVDNSPDLLSINIEFTGKYNEYPELKILNKEKECIWLRVDDIITFSTTVENCMKDVVTLINPKYNKETGTLEVDTVIISNKLVSVDREEPEVNMWSDIPAGASSFTTRENCSDDDPEFTVILGPDNNNLPISAESLPSDKLASSIIFLLGFWGISFLVKEMYINSNKLIKFIFIKNNK